jgi:hypothetical protein
LFFNISNELYSDLKSPFNKKLIKKHIAMKNVYLSLFFTLLGGFSLCSQNVLTEDFIFDPIDSLENLGEWNRSGINSDFNIKVVSPGLEYGGYVGSGRGNTSLVTNDGNGDIVYRNFDSAIVKGAVYMSFMFRVDSLPTTVTQGYPLAFNPNTGGTNLNSRLSIKRETDSTFKVGIQKAGGFITLFSDSTYDIHKTYLLVIKYEIIPGLSNDVASLFLFKSGIPGSEPAKALLINQDGEDYTGQASVYINNNYAQDGLKGCNLKIDGIRVGTSWETSVLAVLTSVDNEKSIYDLKNKNFPNPFQNNTKISYQLPAKGRVKVTIYNTNGIQCAELINKIEESGTHEVEWDASNMPAGNYSCLIQFNGKAISNKLLLVK